jgi:hypothetical protein
MIGLGFLKIMLLYLNCTANLGDFLNSLPVFSGLSKNYPISLVIKNEMRKFNGIIELLEYQNIFDSVKFDDTKYSLGDRHFIVSSWTRDDKSNNNTPTETCRYENWLKDAYHFDFNIDNDFVLKVPDYNINTSHLLYGDRWIESNIDTRRRSHILTEFTMGEFLDFSKPILENAYKIKTAGTFVSTFTGVAVLADLMNVKQYVVYDSDLENWDNKSIHESFYKHFYRDRHSTLININDFRVEYELFY